VKTTNYEVPHYAIFSTLLLGYFLLLRPRLSSSLCSQTPSIYFLPLINVGNEDSHPYKTPGKITLLYIFIFTFLESRRKYKRC
jgi:hypothetical protein